jgi:hypothetical protein
MTLRFRPRFTSAVAAALLALVLAAAPAPGGMLSRPFASSACGPTCGMAAKACHPASAVLVGSWSSALWRPVESTLSSRAGLLRVGAVGMVLALIIIMCGHKWSK